MTTESKKVIYSYLQSIIEGFISQAKALLKLKHNLTKGQLREVFVQNFIKHFLPGYLDIGTGIIINNQGDESKQNDLIIYDNRMLSPFLLSVESNIFPIESVVATIEVKSFLNSPALMKTEKNASYLIKHVWEKNNWGITPPKFLFIACLFGFDGHNIKGLSSEKNKWISENISALRLICSVDRFSWAKIYSNKTKKPKWNYGNADDEFKEIRRFLSLFVDNLRTISNNNWLWSFKKHNDWLGQYVRLK
jgi:hypothetical protein